ncbi:MAG: CheR family methyltransferase [Solirubrobacteraceae bacterium]
MTDRAPTQEAEAEAFETLLEFLKLNRGFDFTGYKRSSLQRRISKRMHEIGVESFADYQDHLEVHPAEFRDLFNTICINVTGFFRDPASWDHVVQETLPVLLEAIPADEQVRVWCAGCASGEEAYTAAIVLAEALGEEAYLERAKIYATDVDEGSLAIARQGTYPSERLDSMAPELAERYFEPAGSELTFRKDLRRTVIFGRNDLVQDAPISRIDLLICRNTLMYFNAETQTHILGHLHFSLNDRGYLFLGKSEMLITRADMFTPVSTKGRVFRKVQRPSLRDRLLVAADGDGDGEAPQVGSLFQLREASFDAGPVAQVVVDSAGLVVLANQQARSLFGLTASDMGRPLHDLEFSFRPADLRSAFEGVQDGRHAVSLGVVQWESARGEDHFHEIVASPLVNDAGAFLGASITFADVQRFERLRGELERSKRELEMAYEELQSTVEELETTNEELQSTNEELETTNEELQSTNEELETLNEELQSTNEELETINEELHQRSSELDRVNAFLEGILTSLGVAVAVVDPDQRIQIWNDQAEELWGLRSDEVVGQHLLSLDIGLPVEKLRRPLRNALAGNVEGNDVVLDAVNRRGRALRCKVSCLPLMVSSSDVRGVIVLMEAEGKESS